mgnify:CR=1 FL=1
MSKFGELIETQVPVLLDFYAEWDEACKGMHAVLRDVEMAPEWGARCQYLNWFGEGVCLILISYKRFFCGSIGQIFDQSC